MRGGGAPPEDPPRDRADGRLAARRLRDLNSSWRMIGVRDSRTDWGGGGSHTCTFYTHAYTDTDTHRHTQTHTDTHRHTQTHTDTDTDTDTHTDTHTHTHTHTQGRLVCAPDITGKGPDQEFYPTLAQIPQKSTNSSRPPTQSNPHPKYGHSTQCRAESLDIQGFDPTSGVCASIRLGVKPATPIPHPCQPNCVYHVGCTHHRG